MNNIFLALSLLVSSGILLLIERGVQNKANRENQTLALSISQAEQERDALKSLLGAARARLNEDRSALADAKTVLNDPPATPALGPENEGLWPTNKPYCYFPKHLLPSARFQQFQLSERGMQLHPNTALMLGMTPEQAAQVSQKIEDLTGIYRDLELHRMERSSNHASMKWKGEKISYRIPALREEMNQHLETFFASTQSILGDSCAKVFNDWAYSMMSESLQGFSSKGRILTFTEESIETGQQLIRFEVAEEGGKELYYYELWNPPLDYLPHGLPQNLVPRFPYRHLFGNHAENRRQPSGVNQ